MRYCSLSFILLTVYRALKGKVMKSDWVFSGTVFGHLLTNQKRREHRRSPGSVFGRKRSLKWSMFMTAFGILWRLCSIYIYTTCFPS